MIDRGIACSNGKSPIIRRTGIIMPPPPTPAKVERIDTTMIIAKINMSVYATGNKSLCKHMFEWSTLAQDHMILSQFFGQKELMHDSDAEHMKLLVARLPLKKLDNSILFDFETIQKNDSILFKNKTFQIRFRSTSSESLLTFLHKID